MTPTVAPAAARVAVKVAAHVRPLSELELAGGCQEVLHVVHPAQILVAGAQGNSSLNFSFDRVYKSAEGDKVLHQLCKDEVLPLVDATLQGFNATILAYGQTGSGKTHTMGSGWSPAAAAEPQLGVMPFVVEQLWRGIEAAAASAGSTFRVTMSVLEDYKEKLFCLTGSKKTKVKVRDTKAGGQICLEGAGVVDMASRGEMAGCLQAAIRKRAVNSTKMNKRSSRSHFIVSIALEQQRPLQAPAADAGLAGAAEELRSRLTLVDLAGSERTKRAIVARGQSMLAEASSINLGLFTLNRVIAALANGQQCVPFRAASLTRALQPSLSGNGHVLMLACVSPAAGSREESLQTLRNAAEARRVLVRPEAGSCKSAACRAEVSGLQQQAAELQAQAKALLAGQDFQGSMASGAVEAMKAVCRLQKEAVRTMAEVLLPELFSAAAGGSSAGSTFASASAGLLKKLQQEVGSLLGTLDTSATANAMLLGVKAAATDMTRHSVQPAARDTSASPTTVTAMQLLAAAEEVPAAADADAGAEEEDSDDSDDDDAICRAEVHGRSSTTSSCLVPGLDFKKLPRPAASNPVGDCFNAGIGCSGSSGGSGSVPAASVLVDSSRCAVGAAAAAVAASSGGTPRAQATATPRQHRRSDEQGNANLQARLAAVEDEWAAFKAKAATPRSSSSSSRSLGGQPGCSGCPVSHPIRLGCGSEGGGGGGILTFGSSSSSVRLATHEKPLSSIATGMSSARGCSTPRAPRYRPSGGAGDGAAAGCITPRYSPAGAGAAAVAGAAGFEGRKCITPRYSPAGAGAAAAAAGAAGFEGRKCITPRYSPAGAGAGAAAAGAAAGFEGRKCITPRYSPGFSPAARTPRASDASSGSRTPRADLLRTSCGRPAWRG